MDIRRVTVCSRTVKMNSSSFLFLSNNLEIPPQSVHEIKAMSVVSQVELGKSTSGKFEAFFRSGPSLRQSTPPLPHVRGVMTFRKAEVARPRSKFLTAVTSSCGRGMAPRHPAAAHLLGNVLSATSA